MTNRNRSLVIASICVLAAWGCSRPAPGPAVSLTTYFEPGVATPFDLLYYEKDTGRESEGGGAYYLAELAMRTVASASNIA